MAAAGIPLLLHLLNLRKLRVMEFSTVRFLLELQQTRVRRLKLQQILLLILRTLLIILAVLAFSRPTVTGSLPLLASSSRASVVILIDNSASMEANDQSGQRFRRAQDAARNVIGMLQEGDEVCVLPLAARDQLRSVGFTRTFAEAESEIDRVKLSESNADVPTTLRSLNSLFEEAAHPHHEVYVISDAQRSTLQRDVSDSGLAFKDHATMFLVRIGQGQDGIEQNHSIDSLNVITKIVSPDKPLEVEAFVRNGSERDATNVMVTMAFNGVRLAQRVVDIPANATRAVVLSAPPQRSGLVRVSIELEDDAIKRDNTRYAGVLIPSRVRTVVVGTGAAPELVATALSLPDSRGSEYTAHRFSSVRDAVRSLQDIDVMYIVNGGWSESESTIMKQFVERGGGIVMFSSEEPLLAPFMSMVGIDITPTQQPPSGSAWRIRSIDEKHPLFSGVFKSSQKKGNVVESPSIRKIRPATGGVAIATSDVGGFLVESGIGSGRVLYVATAVDPDWSSMGGTGLFAATMVRAALYLMQPRDAHSEVLIGETITATIPSRFLGEPSFVVSDNSGVVGMMQPARLSTSSILTIPAQVEPGVVGVHTQDSTAVAAVTVNAPMQESRLEFFGDDEWRSGMQTMVAKPDRVVVTQAGEQLAESARAARTGSELWPLCIVLAVLCAVAESLVSRFMASEESTPLPA